MSSWAHRRFCGLSSPIVLGCTFTVIILLIYANFLPSVPARVSFSRARKDDIHNTTLGFEKILVVGLPKRSDRRDGMILQAGLSDIKIDFIDGVYGADIAKNAVPKTIKDQEEMANMAVLGSWRAHMNAIREIVRLNLTSALIMEDDVDWDVRLKQQLSDFARSTNALTQPLKGSAGETVFADPTFRPRTADQLPLSSTDTTPDISFNQLPQTVTPTVSPYGDNWDLLWFGHCGMQFPSANNGPPHLARGRVIHNDDTTVPEKRYLWSIDSPFTLVDNYPEHTRATHHISEGVCTLAYAVTQRAAQQLLHEIALQSVTDAFDIMLRFFCEGISERRHRPHTCLTVQPALVHHHRPAGPKSAMSDIGDHGIEFNEHPGTDMVRWSVRMNADAILEGRTEYWDALPDST